jgi:hypothetical protein
VPGAGVPRLSAVRAMHAGDALSHRQALELRRARGVAAEQVVRGATECLTGPCGVAVVEAQAAPAGMLVPKA